jgi:hypothetical protein
MAYMRGDMGGVFKGVTGLIKTATGNNKKAGDYSKATRTSSADVVSNGLPCNLPMYGV